MEIAEFMISHLMMCVLQEGREINFFYRPKVNREEAHGPDDVQRMYIVHSRSKSSRPPMQL